MSKRRLSKRQVERIQQKRRAATGEEEPPQDAENLQPGLVVSRYGDKADIEADSGTTLRCSLRKHLGSLVAGDRVLWRPDGERGVVESLCPRHSALIRPDSFGNLKAIAANIDCMIITLALSPEPHGNLVDRYLVAAANLNINAVILINKYDLFPQSDQANIKKIIDCYDTLNIPIVRVSVKTGEGIDELQRILRDQTSVFVGQSGVGKSSIMQTLMPDEQIKIGRNSAHLAKGKHTTTNATLYHFPLGGDCIDSPGIREFGLWHLTTGQVLQGFPDLLAYSEKCKFRNCAHENEPGCAIQNALIKNEVELIRYQSFKRIIASLNEVKIKTKNQKPQT